VATTPASPASAPANTQKPASTFSEGTVTPTTGRPGEATPVEAAKPTPPPPKPTAAPSSTARGSGKIVLTSVPSKASVTINGKWIGRTPLTIERPYGKYAVRIVQPGYDVTTETVTLSSSSSSRTIDATLRPKQAPAKQTPPPARQPPSKDASAKPAAPTSAVGVGEIFVDSRPQGARVFVDGKPQGVTPLRLTGQSVGTHEIRLELADHQTWSATTRVVAGATARVTGSLDRNLR
jgi:hypothetical protein